MKGNKGHKDSTKTATTGITYSSGTKGQRKMVGMMTFD